MREHGGERSPSDVRRGAPQLGIDRPRGVQRGEEIAGREERGAQLGARDPALERLDVRERRRTRRSQGRRQLLERLKLNNSVNRTFVQEV